MEFGQSLAPLACLSQRSARCLVRPCVVALAAADRPHPHPPTPLPPQLDPGYNLLPRKSKKDNGKKCLVLDLDETLVHSSFKVGQPLPLSPSPSTLDAVLTDIFLAALLPPAGAQRRLCRPH